MIKRSKKLFLLFVIISAFSTIFAMEESEYNDDESTSVFIQPESLLNLAAIASFNALSAKPLDAISNDLTTLPCEIKEGPLAQAASRVIEKETGNTHLHLAKTSEEIEKYLALGADTQAKNFFGQIPLTTLLLAKKIDVLKKIVQRNQYLDITDHFGFNTNTLLKFFNGDDTETSPKESILVSFFSSLFNKQKKLTKKEENPEIEKNSLEMLHHFLSIKEAKKAHAFHMLNFHKLQQAAQIPLNELGETALHLAQSRSDVKKLLSLAADPNKLSTLHETPLHTLIRNGYSEAAVTLLKKAENIDFNIRTLNSMSCLDYAILVENIKLIEILLDKKAKLTDQNQRYGDKNYLLTFCLVIDSNNPKIFDLFKNIFTRLSQIEKVFLTYYVAKPETKHLIPIIIGSNDIKTLNFRGVTPLLISVENENLTTMNILLEMGADPTSIFQSQNVLFTALLCKDPSLYKQLLKLTGKRLIFDFNGNPIVNASGETVLIYAAKHNGEAVRDIIKLGCPINAQDAQGNTALIRAIKSNNNTAFYYLIGAEADINLANNKGTTPLMIATKPFQKSYIRQLLALGANLDAKDNKGHKARHYCQERFKLDYDLLTISVSKRTE